MKIRNGFVSNSSSSSFIVLIPVDAYNKLEITPLQKEIVKYIGKNKTKVFGQDAYVISWWSGNIDTFEDFSSKVAENGDDVYEARENLVEMFKKAGAFTHSMHDS
jgi:hypothetical protein